jgi:transcriptional regulator with XRE-family HTH domain
MIDNNLKDCREELEMTQKELGFVFGVSKNTVSGWENGHDTMPFNKLIRFCNLYDYSLDYAIGFIRRNIKYDKIKTDKNKIGKKLKEIRNDLNLTQTKLSEQCGISQSTYSAYESGKYLINTLTIYTICMKYNISMDYIVGRSNKKNIL